jgi:predicted ArsR family transcriptional regulator
VYEPVAEDLAITIPERRYQLIAEILADAVAAAPDDAAAHATRLAAQRGEELGARLREAGEKVDLTATLEGLGFDPQPADGERVRLHNCPFHALATRHTELICGINHAFVAGLLRGLAMPELTARLAPTPGSCCVELAPAAAPVAGD